MMDTTGFRKTGKVTGLCKKCPVKYICVTRVQADAQRNMYFTHQNLERNYVGKCGLMFKKNPSSSTE